MFLFIKFRIQRIFILSGGGKMCGKIKNIKKNSGQAVLELALVLPILVVIVFGMIDFGRMINAKLVASEASREGARQYAIEHNESDAVTLMNAWPGTASLYLNNHTAQIIPDYPVEGCVTAEVKYDVIVITPGVYELLKGTALNDTFQVQGKTIMRME